jgi:hypothetical protein
MERALLACIETRMQRQGAWVTYLDTRNLTRGVRGGADRIVRA